MKLFLSILILCINSLFISVQSKDSAYSSYSLLYRWNNDKIDSTYLSNATVLHSLKKYLNTKATMLSIDTVIITASASPEGNPLYNKDLAYRRAESLKKYICELYNHSNLPIFKFKIIDENWEGLEQMAISDTQLPHSKQAIELIRADIELAEREEALKQLGGGITWDYISKHYLKYLRTGATAVMIYSKQYKKATAFTSKQMNINRNDSDLNIKYYTNKLFLKKATPKRNIAIKSNLLYDACGALNIGVEMPIRGINNLSLEMNFVYCYWRLRNLYALQTIQGGIEARYWLSRGKKEQLSYSKRPLCGWYIGSYAMWCHRYDIQYIKGIQGDGFWSAGISGGYALPISRHFSIEAGIAFGYLKTPEARFYTRPIEGHLMYDKSIYSKVMPFYIPTKLQCSLVWLITTGKNQ